MNVPNCTAFIAQSGTKQALAQAIANVSQTDPSIVNVSPTCAGSRRLAATMLDDLRRLQLQAVVAAYSITVPATYNVSATAVQSALAKNTPEMLTNAVQSAFQAAGLSVNVTVTSVVAPTLKSNAPTTNKPVSSTKQKSVLALSAIASIFSLARLV
jgi:hypothetical protein